MKTKEDCKRTQSSITKINIKKKNYYIWNKREQNIEGGKRGGENYIKKKERKGMGFIKKEKRKKERNVIITIASFFF